MGPAGSRVLGRSHDHAIRGVEIHLIVVEDVPQHAGALEHVDMLAGVGDARHVVKVLRRGIPVLARFPIGDHHRRAGRGEMHLAAAEGQIVFGFLPVQGQVPPGRFQGLLHHRPGHFQAAVGADDGANAPAGLQTVGRGLAEANLLQDPENIVADRCHSRVRQGPELSPALPRTNGLQRVRQWRAAQGPPRFSTPRLPCHCLSPREKNRGQLPPGHILANSPLTQENYFLKIFLGYAGFYCYACLASSGIALK